MRQIIIAIIDIHDTSDIDPTEVFNAVDAALQPLREEGVDWTYKQHRRTPPGDLYVDHVRLIWKDR